MIVILENDEIRMRPDLHRQFLRMRKRVFADRFGWIVASDEESERDPLDDQPHTLVLLMDEAGTVTGGVRMIPTLQQTYLDYFARTVADRQLPDNLVFRGSTIWELSRYCISPDLAGADRRRAAIDLLGAVVDFSRDEGLTEFVVITEAQQWKLAGGCVTRSNKLIDQIQGRATAQVLFWSVDSATKTLFDAARASFCDPDHRMVAGH